MQLKGFTEISEVLRGGVYALAHKGTVVYVGKAKVMLTRVYTHRSAWGASRQGKAPKWVAVRGILYDQVFVQPCHPDRVDELEREMIELYKPKYNTLLKTKSKILAPLDISVRGIAIRINDEKAEQPMERRI